MSENTFDVEIRSTNMFKYSSKNALSHSKYVSVYEGMFNNMKVVVKRIMRLYVETNWNINEIMNLEHRNLLKILGAEQNVDFRLIYSLYLIFLFMYS